MQEVQQPNEEMRVFVHPNNPDQIILDVGSNIHAARYLKNALNGTLQYDTQHQGFVMDRTTWKALRGCCSQSDEAMLTFIDQWQTPATRGSRSVYTQTGVVSTDERGTQTNTDPAPEARANDRVSSASGSFFHLHSIAADVHPLLPRDTTPPPEDARPVSVAALSHNGDTLLSWPEAQQKEMEKDRDAASICSGVSDFRFIFDIRARVPPRPQHPGARPTGRSGATSST